MLEPMTLQLYEVAGAEEAFRPSPYCWRIRMALAHKGLAFEAVPWHAVEKDRIAASGGGTVPVLVDGDRWYRDSWTIACYLEEQFPNTPRLFASDGDRAKARWLDHWVTDTLHPLIFRAVVSEMLPRLAREDQAYYRERTQRRFGQSLDQLAGDPEAAVPLIEAALQPFARLLVDMPYLGGAEPDYGDYLFFGAFQWARVASRRTLLDPVEPAGQWFDRLLDSFGGFARSQPSRAAWP